MANSTKHVVHIQVDASEATSGIPRRLAAIEGVSVSESRLDCGDYLCSDTVVVERKTATDFIASIMDRRLFEQVANMGGAFERSILLLEGDPYATRSGIAPAALDGAFSWLATLSSVTMIPSSGIEHSVRLITTIARHAQHGLGYEIPLRAGKPKTVELQRQFLIEGLPGIGPGRAKKLLEHFGTPLAIFEATMEQLQNVPGIGESAANGIFRVLHESTSKTKRIS